MIQCLLDKKANIRGQNKDERGDNVLHSLVRHAKKNPEEILKVKETFSYLLHQCQQYDSKSLQDKSESQQDTSGRLRDTNKSPQHNNKSPQDNTDVPLWLEKNGDNFTVLSLAVAKGVVEIVRFIIEEQNKLCSEDRQYEYHDITNVDTFTNRISEKKSLLQEKGKSKYRNPLSWLTYKWKSKKMCPSVLEMLAYNEMDNEKAHEILQIKTIKTVLTERWKIARSFIRVWMVIHFVFMIFITVYSSMYANAIKHNTRINIGVSITISALALLYFAFIPLTSLYRKLLGPCRLKYWYFNLVYLLLILLCVMPTMMHVFFETLYLLTISVLTGWSFMIFFLSTFKYFSFFTVMFKRVFIRNLLSYSLVMAIQLISFTTVMYMVLNTGNDAYEFRDVLFRMFQLMVGLGEMEDVENTESPTVSYIIYIAFILITYLVLMNALIAMMSEIFISLTDDFKLYQWRLEQLSALLFLEEIPLLRRRLKKKWKPMKKYSKYIWKIEKYPVKKTKQELNKERELLAQGPDENTLTPSSSNQQTSEQNLDSSKGENNHLHEFQRLVQGDLVNGTVSDTNENDISTIAELPKYVLTNKIGHPLATIVVQNAQDVKPLLQTNVNVIDVETHSPGLIILADAETKRTLSIHIEEQDLIITDQRKTERSRYSKNKVHPTGRRIEREIKEADEEVLIDKCKADQIEDDNTLRSHSITEESSSYFDLPKYVLTDKSGQPFASVYVHEVQVPSDPDILNRANVIDVETHSPGLIVLEDPEEGRKLNIHIKEQHFDDKSITQQKKKRKHEEKILTKTNDGNEGRNSNDREKSVTQKSSIIDEDVIAPPKPDENNDDSSQKSFYLTNKSGCHVATVKIHGHQEKKHDLSMFNVIDVETNPSAVIIFDDKKHSRRFNIHVEEEHLKKTRHRRKKKENSNVGRKEGEVK